MRFLIFLVIISIFSCTDENIVVTRTKQEQFNLDLERIQGYLNENNLEGFESLDNGLHYKILEEGNSSFPKNGDTLDVEYVGQLLNGLEFDRSYTNQPFEFILGSNEVIQGWELGVPLIDEEGTILLIIPSGLAYGTTTSGSIPENSVLIFRIKLLDIR
ncbi:MAG: peptidylprolyl isomerase [Flammeovirgaceae bacterium]|jgi:FKBP-type peptidyl-prolyl cis-trans isomerase FkpA|nr:peptidylprolyl isomerase [Flammeovirgaceae bacterium]|tara:strand:- start:5148 stop:5624 length:477 start_codon:yes stop_codon:yes gene_type:complete